MRGKMPLKLVLIILIAVAVNFALVLGLQAVIHYRAEGPVDAAALARMDDSLTGCEILDHKEIDQTGLHVYLVKQTDGNFQLVTLRKHYIMNRYRLLQDACQPWSGTEEEMTLKVGVYQYWISVRSNAETEHYQIRHLGNSVSQHAGSQFKNTMIFSITGLCILEFAAWCLLFRREEIA